MSAVATGALHFRTIWISDTHLGTTGCQAGRLLEFLRCTESDYLYLVGDIIDGWQLRRRWYWHPSHNDVVQIHKAEIRDIGGVLCCNDGDWVESLTALVEKPNGTLEILHWQELARSDPIPDPEESSIDAHPDRYRRLVAAG